MRTLYVFFRIHMHYSSYNNMRSFVDRYITEKNLNILDVGSGDINGTYKDLFTEHIYKGLDITPGENVDIVVADHYHWTEIQSGSVDVVVSGQTLEHVPYPWETMKEIARILKNDGICCVIVPSTGPEHKYPLDCYRFYSDGVRALAEWVGLEVLSSYTDTSPEAADWGDTVLIARKKHDSTIKVAPLRKTKKVS